MGKTKKKKKKGDGDSSYRSNNFNGFTARRRQIEGNELKDEEDGRGRGR